MAEENTIVAKSRTDVGSSMARRMRRDGRFPGAINAIGGGTLLIELGRHDFEKLLSRHAGENLILDVVIDGKPPKKALLKEVQHEPVSDAVLHADFTEISMTEKMRFRVSILLVGEAVGVTQDGGVQEQQLREIEVECLPTDLVESVDVDVSALTIGDSLLAGDLKIDPKLSLLTPADISVVSVLAPRVEEEPEPEEEAAAAEGEEPEVIGEEKEGEDKEEKKSGGEEKAEK